MKISYAITVCNEGQEFRELLDFLVPRIRKEDEIVVLQDTSKVSEEVDKVFVDFADHIKTRVTANFEEDFAAWKNRLNSYCTGDYIFQIDADEVPNELLLKYLPALLEENPEVDLYLVSRQNIVNGLTDEDIKRWRWTISQRSSDGVQIVNWPDWQTRIYKKGLEWKGKVHERIVGFKKYGKVPTTLYLVHIKNIEKQRQQNQHYDKIIQNG